MEMNIPTCVDCIDDERIHLGFGAANLAYISGLLHKILGDTPPKDRATATQEHYEGCGKQRVCRHRTPDSY